MDKQKIIKQLIWNMACSASEQNANPFRTNEYKELYDDFDWKFMDYKNDNEWLAHMTNEEQIMFVFMIYYSLP